MRLVQRLEERPTDIIGDIHGELEALECLLHALGYDDAGRHPQNRLLVFTGDLVDRGANSPGIMEKVIALAETNGAQCVLGNHELNILRGVRKGGNEWILDNGAPDPNQASVRFASATQRRKFLSFLERQPLVLEGRHLRIVHACWNASAVNELRTLQDGSGIGSLYRQLHDRILMELSDSSTEQLRQRESELYSEQISDPSWTPLYLPGHAEVDLALQMRNPLRVLTTSEEKIAARPFWAGGKWRMVERCRWWDDYSDQVPVVIGHFWRLFDAQARRIAGMFGPDVFAGVPSHAWMGQQRNVYCVDYSVGQRQQERQHYAGEDFHGKLAALRFPEWQVVHDDGTAIEIGPPGGGAGK